MGRVIRVDNKKGEPQSVLTETGTGGLLSSGYLSEEPAISYLEADETAVFVLTNKKRGVEMSRGGEPEQITAGTGYRTIAVVTDRRLLILVGDSDAPSVDGDQCLSVQLVDIDGVTADVGRRDGSLTVRRASGKTVTIHTGSDGLEDVAEYITAASQTWINVENTIDDVKRSLVAATGHRDACEYDAALEAATEAYHGLNEPRRRANTFDSEWVADAMIARVDQVQVRCVKTLADVRLGRARQYTDDAESHWRDEEFERAHDAYEDARAELESILTYDTGSIEDRDEIAQEAEQVERVMERLEEAPLRRAVEADRDAADTEEPTTAAELWEDALEYYTVAMELDWGAEERRFAGDPDQIRERLGEIVDRLVSARRTAATKAKRAGDWYVGAEQYDVAIEEFETAREQYDLALEVAHDRYPDATDHLTVERDAIEERIERARDARDGADVGPVETEAAESIHEPAYDVEATIGDGDGDAETDGSADGGSVDAETDGSTDDGDAETNTSSDEGRVDAGVEMEPDIER